MGERLNVSGLFPPLPSKHNVVFLKRESWAEALWISGDDLLRIAIGRRQGELIPIRSGKEYIDCMAAWSKSRCIEGNCELATGVPAYECGGNSGIPYSQLLQNIGRGQRRARKGCHEVV